MANHASHAALPYPVKGARYTVLIPYLDADGDPTDPTTPDTEISKDDGAAADTAEEVSSPKNSVGMLTLSGAEMDCSSASLAAKAASGPKTTLLTLYPRVLPVIFSGTAQAGAAGTLTLATDIPAIVDLLVGCILKTTGGTGGGGTGGANNQARVITDFTTGRVASVAPNWETSPDATTTYEVLLTEAALMRYADLQLWRGSQPNALTSGRVETLVGAITNGVIAAASFAAGALDAVWSTATRTLSAFAFSVTVGTNNDKTGYGLSAAAIQAIWDALTSALTTVGSIGKLLVDNINATISSRLATSGYTAPLDAAGTRTALGLASANLDTQLDALPTAAENATAVWAAGTRELTGFDASFKTGFSLTAAATLAFWDVLEASVATANSMGIKLKNTLPIRLTKNTAFARFMFVMVQSADHLTPATGLTITATRSLDGAAFGACANSAVEVANGVYYIDLAAADVNANCITLRFTATGADTRLLTLLTQPAAA
jgi:hypothetical protein